MTNTMKTFLFTAGAILGCGLWSRALERSTLSDCKTEGAILKEHRANGCMVKADFPFGVLGIKQDTCSWPDQKIMLPTRLGPFMTDPMSEATVYRIN